MFVAAIQTTETYVLCGRPSPTLPYLAILQMPLDGPQLAEQGVVFNKNFFADFKVSGRLISYRR